MAVDHEKIQARCQILSLEGAYKSREIFVFVRLQNEAKCFVMSQGKKTRLYSLSWWTVQILDDDYQKK